MNHQIVNLPTEVSKFIDLFVGNTDNHIIWDHNSEYWRRAPFPITPALVMRHFLHQLAIGSYPIYKCNGWNCCRWICIDIDSHERVPKEKREAIRAEYEPKVAKLVLKRVEREYAKRVDKELFEKQEKFVRNLYKSFESLSNIPKECTILEKSGGGFHLWIFLEEGTRLENAGKFVYDIKPKINEMYINFFGEDEELPEFYPKQYTIDHLDKRLGNAVRLPLGKNFGKDVITEIIEGDIETTKKTSLDAWENIEIPEEEIQTMNRISTSRPVFEEYDEMDIKESLDFWNEFLRPCFQWIVSGKTQCYGSHGHYMRMALVHECNYNKIPFEAIVDCFRNQYDFDEQLTRIQINSVLKSSNRRDGRYGCDKIKLLGYCIPECDKYEE